MPRPNCLVIETRRSDCEWTIYTEDSIVPRTSLIPTGDGRALFEAEEPVTVAHPEDNAARQSDLGVLPLSRKPATNEYSNLELEDLSLWEYPDEFQESFHNNHQLHRVGSPLLESYGPYSFSEIGPLVKIGESGRPDGGHLQLHEDLFSNLPKKPTYGGSFPPWARVSLFSQLQTAVLAMPARSNYFKTQSLHNVGTNSGREVVINGFPQSSPKSLLKSLLQDATEILTSNSTPEEAQEFPDLDDVLDDLLSLLPESMQRSDFGGTEDIIPKNNNFEFTFYNALLYSIANSFAGLRNIPSRAILRMLKKHSQMSSWIIESLSSCPPAQAKCLADNLFRVAIEACDEEVVIFILQATRNSPNAINTNDIVCRLDGKDRLYTPIELAAKFRHLGMVKILLEANANVNKTFGQEKMQEHGALECAIRMWGTFKSVDMTIIRAILDYHAEIRVELIEAAIRWGQPELIHELVSRLPPVRHSNCFHSTILRVTAMYLENNLAAQIIEQIFEYCQSTNCMRCSAEHQPLMEDTLCVAAMRGNFKLVKLIIPHTKMKDGGLAAAIRNGSRELIDLLLFCGGSVGGPPCYLDRLTQTRSVWKVAHNIPTTTLAEAIRSQDKELIHEFENLGALSHMDQKLHFEAAMIAAAEIGDCQYIKSLLHRVPTKRGAHLADALFVAIHMDQTEAALVLLDNEASVGYTRVVNFNNSALLEALGKHNRAVINEILETEFDTEFCMEAAGVWGDMSVVKDLIFVGADIDMGENTTALIAAIESRRTDLVTLLLENGASTSAFALSKRTTPLTAAVENQDDKMIQLLISVGADPADDKAFVSAINKNRETFNKLVQAFSLRYPNGKPKFGGIVLIEAVKRRDDKLLKTMLDAKFDVNNCAEVEDSEMTALGFAISDGKLMNEKLSILLELINRSDLNRIIRRLGDYEIDKKPKTALIIAVESRNEQIVKLLLENGADLHLPARLGLKRTPLQQACEIGSYKMVKLLLEHNANVNEEPAARDGATALQLAAISGSIKIAELLLSHGALVHANPAKVGGLTAFEGAAKHGCVEMLRVLWDAVAGIGFGPEQIEKAKSLALSGGHRGCAEYIDTLSSVPSLSLLDM